MSTPYSSPRRKHWLTISPPSVLNGLAVKWFGVSEFYLSSFKIFLMLGLIMYTFVTMVGGNPSGHAYGFTYWNDPVSRTPPILDSNLEAESGYSHTRVGSIRRAYSPGRFGSIPRIAVLHGPGVLYVSSHHSPPSSITCCTVLGRSSS